MEEYFDILDENANYLNQIATRDEAHKKGLWHRAIVVFIVNKKGEVLLQRRSANKKMWPNMWDVSVGGHCLSGEFGFETAIRETHEELGLEVRTEQLLYIGISRSSRTIKDIKDNMFNEYFVAFLDFNPSTLTLQKEEVSMASFINVKQLKNMMNSENELTPKQDAFETIIRFLDKQNN